MLKVATALKSQLAEIVFMGDFAENLVVSRHKKAHPTVQYFHEEVSAVNEQLDHIDKLFPKVKKTYIEGNHEKRMDSYISDKAPELFGLTDIKKQFKIKERGYRWIDYEPRQYYSLFDSGYVCRHEPVGSSTKTTALRGGSRVECIVFGHVHTFEEATQGHLSPKGYEKTKAKACGVLADVMHPTFQYSGVNGWCLGFMLFHYVDRSNCWLEQVEITQDYKAYALGKVFSI